MTSPAWRAPQRSEARPPRTRGTRSPRPGRRPGRTPRAHRPQRDTTTQTAPRADRSEPRRRWNHGSAEPPAGSLGHGRRPPRARAADCRAPRSRRPPGSDRSGAWSVVGADPRPARHAPGPDPTPWPRAERRHCALRPIPVHARGNHAASCGPQGHVSLQATCASVHGSRIAGAASREDLLGDDERTGRSAPPRPRPTRRTRVENERSRSIDRPKGSRSDRSSARLNEPSSGHPKPRSASPNSVSPSSSSSVASQVPAPAGLKSFTTGTGSGSRKRRTGAQAFGKLRRQEGHCGHDRSPRWPAPNGRAGEERPHRPGERRAAPEGPQRSGGPGQRPGCRHGGPGFAGSGPALPIERR